MSKSRPKAWSPEVLTYQDGKRRGSIVRRHYLRWRLAQDPPRLERCDNSECRFHTEPLIWNNKPLKMILDHKNGVNTDNQPCNLQFLCPNCDSQNEGTRGGANKGRVRKSTGGFATQGPDGGWSHVMPAQPGRIELTGRDAELEISRPISEPDDLH